VGVEEAFPHFRISLASTSALHVVAVVAPSPLLFVALVASVLCKEDWAIAREEVYLEEVPHLVWVGLILLEDQHHQLQNSKNRKKPEKERNGEKNQKMKETVLLCLQSKFRNPNQLRHLPPSHIYRNYDHSLLGECQSNFLCLIPIL